MKAGLKIVICAVLTFMSTAQILFSEVENKYTQTYAIELYRAGNFKEAAIHLAMSKIASCGKIPTGLQKFFLELPEIACEFADIISPEDNISEVFRILSELWTFDEKNFRKLPRIALAISIVYDSPPPESWPHSQVPSKVLIRKFRNSLDELSKIANSRSKIQPEKLSIEEAKYLVSSISTDADALWVKRSIAVNIPNIEKLYSSIRYDNSRIEQNRYDWELPEYSLQTIKKTGGICVDQAYFTSEVAKNIGVPSFILSGVGSDGFHAWVAYMLKEGTWNFDVGRYEAARFVTGHTLDPQTWLPASDHALSAMRERFRYNSKYQLNLIHTNFARIFFDMGDFDSAGRASREAIASDSRNADSWNILADALRSDNKEFRSTYLSAVKAFARYPDIEAEFRRKLIAATPDSREAQKISSEMITKTRHFRPDIAMNFARAELEKNSLDKSSLKTSYKRLLNSFKSDEAMIISELTLPLLNKFISACDINFAMELWDITLRSLRVSDSSPLSYIMENISKQLNEIQEEVSKKNY